MKNTLVKKAVPHIIAILIFLIISVLFNKTAFEGNVLNQHDVVGWKGMAQGSFDYKEKHGHFPLWNTNLFSGMPNYMIIMGGKGILPDFNKIIGLGLPQPANFFFIACICFYILCLSLRLKPIVGIFGALAFAYATYNPIIVSAGHNTKILAIAYMPLLLAGILLIYEKRYWLGLALTVLGTYLEVGAAHPQINFYFFLVALAVTISYIVSWVKRKELKHMGIALGITAFAALVGILPHTPYFLTSSEYAKATIRGGKSIEVNGDKVSAAAPTKGLDTSYAFAYSLGKAEALTTLMPNAFGGSAKNRYDENSKIVDKLAARGIPEANAAQIASNMSKFWGDPESTAGGPLYAGIIVCLLALIGFILYKHPLRWGLLAISLIALLMSWGKNLPGFNVFLFNNLPLYNKFRAPSMTMIIIQLILPIAAVLGMQLLFFREKSYELLKADFKKILYASGGLIAFLLLMYLMMDYSSPIDAQILGINWDNSGNDQVGRLIVSAMKDERRSLFGLQLLRTVFFTGLVLGLLWLYLKNVLKPMMIAIALTVVSVIDLLVVDKNYLNEENYISKDEQESTANAKTSIDNQILADKDPHYRVYSLSPERFSASDYHVSTYHRAVGGYHPAKLRIYQDLIERYLSGGEPGEILNMLDAKYIVFTNPENGQQALVPNTKAYGPCWLVKHVKIVKDDIEEIQTIGVTQLRDTAVVQQSFSAQVTQPQWDSTASIALTRFDNDVIEYTSTANTPQFAVFSEIYYPYGWNAYIDGNKVPYVKANYVLRGISVPAGKHSIKFVFEPSSYKTGTSMTLIGSLLLIILVVGGIFMAWRNSGKTAARNEKSA